MAYSQLSRKHKHTYRPSSSNTGRSVAAERAAEKTMAAVRRRRAERELAA